MASVEMEIRSDENALIGKWTMHGTQVSLDEVSLRISQLIEKHLVKVGTDPSGWNVLFKDPKDGRFWELSYPESHLQGGGPPALRHLPEADVKANYKTVIGK